VGCSAIGKKKLESLGLPAMVAVKKIKAPKYFISIEI
jgi:3,4-dihydroxy-2-butanone 4-phosphate synthase